jgi:hypothetical protein
MPRPQATIAGLAPAPSGLVGLACAVAVVACSANATPPPSWSAVVESSGAALLSVSGTSADDVWMVGADDGSGPLVLHRDSSGWARLDSGTRGHLWWVHAFSESLVLTAGAGGQVLRVRQEGFEPRATPGGNGDVVFGVWAAAEDDVYAVGAAAGETGFLWHDSGTGFVPVPLPALAGSVVPSLFKVWGTSSGDVWVVGERGVVLRGSARDGFALVASSVDERLFTVHASAGRVVMVGGSANGVALESGAEGLRSITPPGAAPLQGTCVTESGDVWAVGVGGVAHVLRSGEDRWSDLVPDTPVQSLHAIWIDPDGAAWAVGGNVLTEELDRGVALRYAAGPPLQSFNPSSP